jgi:large subunit ribosomal protein L23
MNADANVKKYNNERLMTVLLAPVVSEKGTFIADKYEQVIFRVAPDATKPEIKAAVELMFKVQVERRSASGASSGGGATGRRPTCA